MLYASISLYTIQGDATGWEHGPWLHGPPITVLRWQWVPHYAGGLFLLLPTRLGLSVATPWPRDPWVFFFHLSLIVRFGQVLPTNDPKFSSILLHPHHPPCFLPTCAHYKFVCFRMLKVNGVSISGIANKLSLLCQVWPWWQQLQKTLFGEGFWSWGLNENDGHDQLAVCAMRRRENVAACWVSSLSHYKGVSLGSATEFNIIWKQIFNSLTL